MPSKAVKDVELKQAFIRLYNNMVKDKGSFFRTFYANVEKVMNKKTTAPDIDKLTKQINVYQSDLSELIQLKLRHQIDESYYNTEYLRITGELETLQEQKESLRDISLDNAKMKEKIAVIKETIGGDTQPLKEFDDELFKILVDRVLIRDAKHVTFIFESGLEFNAELYAEDI